jgi:putative transposase
VARRLREDLPDSIHHVFARGNRKQALFHDDRDRRTYLGLLAQTARRMRWRCLAYCLMDNHVHLVIETRDANLGAGMQRLHGTYAQGFNRRYGAVGHLFQGRYGSVRITSDPQLWAVVRYVAVNPVEAGVCSAPDEYEWSSHPSTTRAEASPVADVPRLLEYFAAGRDPVLLYQQFVASPVPSLGSRASRAGPVPM